MRQLALLIFLFLTGTASGEEQRFTVEGNRLLYNSLIPYAGGDEIDIVGRDAEELALYLMEYPDIDTVVLTSEGGSSLSALEMGKKVNDLGLATEVTSVCYSACPYIFLGGRPRVLKAGAKLGFHRSHVTPQNVKDFEPDPTLAASVAYDQAIDGSVKVAQYMLWHGVTDEFVLAVMGVPPREDWVPSRAELVEAGVIDADR